MSEKESDQPEIRVTRAELLKAAERIKANAVARVLSVEVPDSRALEGEDNLVSVGETWLRQEIRQSKELHYVRLFILGLLLVLVVLWLVSIPALLILVGTHWKDFELSDIVVITYMGSTTVSVLGLMRIATRWLYAGGLPDLAESFKEILHKR